LSDDLKSPVSVSAETDAHLAAGFCKQPPCGSFSRRRFGCEWLQGTQNRCEFFVSIRGFQRPTLAF